MVAFPRYISVAAGIGGIDLGLRMVEPRARAVAYCERDPFAASVLVARMEEKALDPAPIWDDLKTFPGRNFSGCVDLVVGGIPCQPWSVAGRRKGISDSRDLWPDFLRLLIESRATMAFLENVPGMLKSGLPRLLGELNIIGWDAVWGVFSCGGLGAPHLRKRLFLLAYTGRGQQVARAACGDLPDWHNAGWPEGADWPARGGQPLAHPGGGKLGQQPGRRPGTGGDGQAESDNPGRALAYPEGPGLETGRRGTRPRPAVGYGQLADASGLGRQFRGGHPAGRVEDAEPAAADQRLANADEQQQDPAWRWHPGQPGQPGLDLANADGDPAQCDRDGQPRIPGLWPPGRDPEQWRDIPESLWPSAPSKPSLCRVDDGVPAWLVAANTYRSDRFRALGNAVSPPVAAVAWSVLKRRMLEALNV